MRRPLIRGKEFHKFSLEKYNKLKEGSWEAFFFKIFVLFFGGGERFKKRRKMSVRKELICYAERSVIHGNNGV
jgi:hypothetical protein